MINNGLEYHGIKTFTVIVISWVVLRSLDWDVGAIDGPYGLGHPHVFKSIFNLLLVVIMQEFDEAIQKSIRDGLTDMVGYLPGSCLTNAE